MQTSDFFDRIPTPDPEAALAVRDRLAPTGTHWGGLAVLAQRFAAMTARTGASSSLPQTLRAHVSLTHLAPSPLISGITSHPASELPAQLTTQPGIECTIRDHPPTAVDEVTDEVVAACLREGETIAEGIAADHPDVVIPAVAGPGSSTWGAILTGVATHTEPVRITGVGLGAPITDEQWNRKVALIRDGMFAAREVHTDPLAVLRTVAEFSGQPALITFASTVAHCASRSLPVLLDGPTAAAAALWADRLAPGTRAYLSAASTSHEPAENSAYSALECTPLTELGLRGVEGTASLAVLPLVRQALLLTQVS
ncbi:MAG: nicotinate-nucleotide--dimethylbenzimidazole phosphoribosyltransferase [Corynebacterium sp.]|nr:nicotinate-nucleotide--dimethylbenzimidazole phosphoribosyltransferase [Corynebacterium sp.]